MIFSTCQSLHICPRTIPRMLQMFALLSPDFSKEKAFRKEIRLKKRHILVRNARKTETRLERLPWVATYWYTWSRDIFRRDDSVRWKESPSSIRRALDNAMLALYNSRRIGLHSVDFVSLLGVCFDIEESLHYEASDIAPASSHCASSFRMFRIVADFRY